MTAFLTLALETSVIAAGIWSAGAAVFYASQYIDKVEVSFHQTEAKLANYGPTEDNASASVVTTVVINPSKGGETSTRIITLDPGATSTSEEAVPVIITSSRKAGKSNDKPTTVPEVSVLIGDKWLEQRKIAKGEVKTRKTKTKGPLPFTTAKRTTFKKVLATLAEELEYAIVKILLVFTTIGNFFASNLQHNFELLKNGSNAFFATTTPYTAGFNSTWCTYIISDCNISSIFEAIWSALQSIGFQLFVLPSYIAAPFIWTGIKIMSPLLRWFIFDIVCPPPYAAFRFASDCFSIISKCSSQIWFMYKEIDTVLFLIVLLFLTIGCVLFCCCGDYPFSGDDDNNNPGGDLPFKAPRETSSLGSPGVTDPSSTPSIRNIPTNNTRPDVTPRIQSDMTNLPELTDAEQRIMRIEADENAARDEDEQNRVYVGANNGSEETLSVKTPITPNEEDNRTTNGTGIRDSVSTHPRGVIRRTIPDPFPNEAPGGRTARLERLAARKKRENEESPQRLRDERERCYQENLQKKQSDLRKRQSEEESRVQEARNQLRSTAEKFLASKGDKIKNTILQPEITLAKGSNLETDKIITTEGGKIKTTVVKAPVRRPTITTDSLVQTPASAGSRPHVGRSHDKTWFNKNDQKTNENGTPLIDLPAVQQPGSQIANNEIGFRGREDPFKKVREPLGIFEVNEKRGTVKYAGTQSPFQPIVGGPDDKNDGSVDIVLGGGHAIAGGIQDTYISFGGYGAETTGLVAPEGPPISIVQPAPRDINPPPIRTATVVDPTLLHASPLPKFNHSRKNGSGKQHTPRTSENVANPNEPPSTPSVEPYDPTQPGLPTSTELTTTKTVEPYDPTKPVLPPSLPVDQYNPTKTGLVHGPSIQEPAPPTVDGLSQAIVQGSAQPPLPGLSLSTLPEPSLPTLPGPSLPTVNEPSQSNGEGSAHVVVPEPTQPTIQGPVQSHGGNVPIEEVSLAPVAPSAPTVLPTIDDDEEMVVDGGNDKPNEDDGNVDMGEADDSPTQGGVNRPLPGIFGSSTRTSAPPPQPPATINNGPWSDDVNMSEDSPEVTMGEDPPQPIPFGTVLAPALSYSINVIPATPRPDSFGTVATSQSSSFGTVGALNPTTIVPAPPQPNPFGTITTEGPSTTSPRSSFSGELPMRATVGNGFGGSQSTQPSITSFSGGHFTPALINNASGEIQHGQGTTVAHTPSTQIFDTKGISNLGAWPHSPGGPKTPSDSGSLTPSQQAKIMTQMLNYTKGDTKTFPATTVSGGPSINSGTGILPSAIATAPRDSVISNISGNGCSPATTRPGSCSTARKSSTIGSDVLTIGGTSSSDMKPVHSPLGDAEKAEKVKLNAKAKKEKDKEKKNKFEEANNSVPPIPRKKLKPRGRVLNTNILKNDDFAKGGKADTGIKQDSSPDRNIIFSGPGPTIPPEETDAERQLRELTAKMDAQADQRRREMVGQNTKLEFGTADDNAEWHEGILGKKNRVVFTKEDFLKKQKEFKRLQRKAQEEAKTECDADALMRKMNAADPARKKRQEKDLESVLAISGGVGWRIANRAEEAKEQKQDDEESEISDLDEADLACITDQVNHNQALVDEAEKLRKQ